MTDGVALIVCDGGREDWSNLFRRRSRPTEVGLYLTLQESTPQTRSLSLPTPGKDIRVVTSGFSFSDSVLQIEFLN